MQQQRGAYWVQGVQGYRGGSKTSVLPGNQFYNVISEDGDE